MLSFLSTILKICILNNINYTKFVHFQIVVMKDYTDEIIKIIHSLKHKTNKSHELIYYTVKKANLNFEEEAKIN